MGVITHKGDAVKWARKYKRTGSPLFHALLCDAPYEMDFMGKGWDGTGVAFDPDTWEAFAGVLHPGAFLFVFAGTINDDLISVAMRKAGLRKFHKIMGWAYGSGFPKASRIDTQIDKAAGAEREILGPNPTSSPGRRPGILRFRGDNDRPIIEGKLIEAGLDRPLLTSPATPLAQAWEGHRYGLQAIKPAIETILVFQKPYEGKPIDDITQTGAGALNIEGGRIPGTVESGWNKTKGSGDKFTGSAYNNGERYPESLERFDPDPSGRWPSNLLLLDPQAARALDEQSGESESKRTLRGNLVDNRRGSYNNAQGRRIENSNYERGYDDSRGASRFFFQVSEQIDEADPVFYCAKASRRERDAGIAELDDMADAQRYGSIRQDRGPGYEEGSRARNPHPTVKPLSLTRYLATLLLPPALYAPRRLFVPFAGVGSEQIGASMAGWEEIEGVEITEEYIPINRARVNYWTLKPKEPIEKSNGSKARSNGHKKANQLELI